ncbi:MAG: helix-turn-helix domain-containing protein [Bacteroidota bacterium]
MTKEQDRQDDFLQQSRMVVLNALDDSTFGVEQLSDALGMSRSQLHRRVKAATGLSTSHFIRQIRLEAAQQMLTATDWNVSEIAYKTGHSTPANFSKYFKAEYGISPSQYRKQPPEEAPQETQLSSAEANISSQTAPPSPSTQKWKWFVLATFLILGILTFVFFYSSPTVLNRLSENVEANKAYERGQFLMQDRTDENLKKAQLEFETALDLDSTFAAAHLGKATVFYLLENAETHPNYWQQAEKLAKQSIALDDKNGLAYALLANIYSDQFEFEKALTIYEKALKLSPDEAMIHYWYSLRLRCIGDFSRSLAHAERANQLDPLHPVIVAGYIYTAILGEEFELAETLLEENEAVFEDMYLYLLTKGTLAAAQGNYEQAIAYYDASISENPDYPYPKTERAFCLAKLGNRAEAIAFLDSLDFSSDWQYLEAATVLGGLEEVENGVTYLHQAAKRQSISSDILVSFFYSPYHQHPTYLAILEQYNLAQYLEH